MTKPKITFVNEIWKDIPGFAEIYQVSNLGNVRSKAKASYWKLLKPRNDHKGYPKVCLPVQNKNYKYKPISVHRLVAIAFVANPNNLPFVNHIDCNPENNKSDNLEWVTAIENNRHAIRSGSRPMHVAGYANTRRFTLVEIEQIINELKSGEFTFDLADKYGVKTKEFSRFASFLKY